MKATLALENTVVVEVGWRSRETGGESYSTRLTGYQEV
jgi:hypothetical protein